ncbi:transcriptional regulatory protein SrrA [Gottschalkia purinilytica]|uniref:Transcriptional regulatory protein SrrA n=1 Tax=Gottschalkia purinilytica TaxID=1503 RepID=A0A0L0WE34_GOTPU|nr:response regulator transcription factor [Gottschalkia purinilytica]KNF09696.1 transcriptional regulatory protein SrrA [Gottschalkia purinilytica]
MNTLKILIVEDEERMRKVIKKYLEAENYEVKEAKDGKEAIEIFNENEFDFILLDIMMPNIDGWTVCREIRKTSSVPIIMLSARGEEYDKLFGFELGVDDYMVKPFSPKELIARIKAILNRVNNFNNKVENTNDTLICIKNLKINTLSNEVYLDDNEIKLTPKEYDLLVFLCENKDITFSREQLLDRVWGYDFYGDLRTVDTHIKQLREKLCKKNKFIHTIWGKGYKLKAGD